jgi:RNA polymerase sigma factor (TIGR02999 family)
MAGMEPLDGPGPGEPVDALTESLYRELREIAARQLRSERPDHTLQPTALVHEAYLRLSRQDSVKWENRTHFLAIASRQIRQILVDHARAKGRSKRGGDQTRVTLQTDVAAAEKPVDLLDLEDALQRLDEFGETHGQIVELKFFGGLTEPEISTVLGISERTVRRRWLFARSWLYRQLVG